MSEKSNKSLNCKSCGELVEKVDISTKEVVCWKCVDVTVGVVTKDEIPEKDEKEAS